MYIPQKEASNGSRSNDKEHVAEPGSSGQDLIENILRTIDNTLQSFQAGSRHVYLKLISNTTPSPHFLTTVPAANPVPSTTKSFLEDFTTSAIRVPRAEVSLGPRAFLENGLPPAAIIGIILGSIIILGLLAITFDVLLLSNRVRRNLRKLNLSNRNRYAPEIQLVLPRSDSITRKPLATPQVPFYDKKIKHSRALSLDSASLYSGSYWDNGKAGGPTMSSIDREEYEEKRKAYYRYSMSVYEEDIWEEWMEEKFQTYKGPIKPGMGVQKRYTASTFGDKRGSTFTFGLKELEMDGDIEALVPPTPRTPRRKFPTWLLNDPQERWRRGLHPLAGKRGMGMGRIGFFK